eukprot:m.272639 g.272639  ORF g.272639 m.272639 type:complete len:259 (-) comp16275_c5_seq5:95-871(-)
MVVMQITGMLQSFYSFAPHWNTVCWALRPREQIQKAAQEYLDSVTTPHTSILIFSLCLQVLQATQVEITKETKIVTIHLRRGDYAVKQDMHGLLTMEYYQKSLQLIKSRITREQGEAFDDIVVVVLTEQENVDWCKKNMNWGPQDGVKATICANAKGKRCNGEEVDMFALSLGDFLVVANSTFSWWSHFLKFCAKKLKGWLVVESSLTNRAPLANGVSVFPHRWYSSRINRSRQKLFDFIVGDVLVPDTVHIFEKSPK